MSRRILTTLALILACALGLEVAAQNAYTFKGVVVDASGPVIGASVLEQGTTNGTVTGLDGDYTLTVSGPDVIVEISCLGYATQTFKASAVPAVVTISEDTNYLDEVVVVGYGTVKRRDLTGSVASVSGEKIAQNPVTNVVQALQGALPGVTVTTQDGRPGANVDIRVRGGNSMTQSNSPLFVVDGVVVSSIDDIPADNIASLDVLKDAASTAIYGARGSNGVIMVTTRTAKEQKATVRYSGYYQIKTAANRYETLDAQDYVWQQWTYGTAYADNYGDGIAKYFGLGSKYGNHYADYANVETHDWFDDIIKTAGSQNHDISLSGGGEKSKIYATIGYNNDEGIRIHSGTERWSGNLKVDQWIASNLKFSADLRYSDFRTHGSNYELASTAYRFRPIDTPLGEDNPGLMMQGSANVDMAYNPIDIIEGHSNISKNQRARATGGLTWDPIPGLTAKTEVSVSRRWSQSSSWKSDAIEDHIATASLTKGNGTDTRWTNTLNYTVQGLGNNHSLNFLLGHEMLTNTNSERELRAYGYSSDLSYDQAFAMFKNYDTSLVNLNSFSNTITVPSNTLSFFGRANYSLMGRYLFTATFRADGSSKFAPNNRWGYFPAAAFAWRISDEPFMRGTRSWIDELKYRLSYGTSGSDGIDSNLWQETWVTDVVNMDGVDYNIYKPGDLLANPDLKWETTISRNTGFDFSFFKTRLRGSLDLYWNTTKDLLMRMPIDNTTGYSYQYQNVGQTSNKGIELSLNAGIVRNRDFQLSVNWNHSFNNNNLDWIDPSANANQRTGWGGSDMKPAYDYVIEVGRPIGLINGYIAEGCGFYTVDDFNYANGVYTLKPGISDTQVASYTSTDLNAIRPNGQIAFPGAVRFKDLDGEEGATAADYGVIAEMQPHHTGGFGFQANWKNFDFSGHFTYQLDGYIYNAVGMSSTNFGNKDSWFGRNRLAYVKDCYKLYDVDQNGNLYMVTDPAALNALNKNAKYPVCLSEAGYVSSQFIEPGGFLRCNNITLGYTVPDTLLERVKLSNLRVYVTGTNLFVLTRYSGLDPETVPDSNASNANLRPGFDNGNYPRPITVTAGLSVTF